MFLGHIRKLDVEAISSEFNQTHGQTDPQLDREKMLKRKMEKIDVEMRSNRAKIAESQRQMDKMLNETKQISKKAQTLLGEIIQIVGKEVKLKLALKRQNDSIGAILKGTGNDDGKKQAHNIKVANIRSEIEKRKRMVAVSGYKRKGRKSNELQRLRSKLATLEQKKDAITDLKNQLKDAVRRTETQKSDKKIEEWANEIKRRRSRR